MKRRPIGCTSRNGLDIPQYASGEDPISEEELARRKAAVRAWDLVWQGLTEKQQAAWHALSRAEKDASYKMTASEFAAFMRGK